MQITQRYAGKTEKVTFFVDQQNVTQFLTAFLYKNNN